MHYWTILKCQEKTLLFFTLEPKLLECALFVLFVIAKISAPLTFRRSDSWLDNSSTNDFDDVMLASWWNVCFILPLTSTLQGRYIDITGANLTIILDGNDLSTTVQHSSRDLYSSECDDCLSSTCPSPGPVGPPMVVSGYSIDITKPSIF